MSIEELYRKLYLCYSKDLCYPKVRDNWNDNNKYFGMCAITSLIVNDYFGGDICKIYVDGISHYYNLVDNTIIDLTSKQFKKEVNYEDYEIIKRYNIITEDTENRYKLLKNKLERILMNIDNDFQVILDYAHYWNWAPDWSIVQQIYNTYPDSYSILTPFAYSYLEEVIRSTTSEYGIEILGKNGNPRGRKVGKSLIKLAKEENKTNKGYLKSLNEIEIYFSNSSVFDKGDNRNSVNHGYMHSRFWTQESFEKLVHDIAKISQYARF